MRVGMAFLPLLTTQPSVDLGGFRFFAFFGVALKFGDVVPAVRLFEVVLFFALAVPDLLGVERSSIFPQSEHRRRCFFCLSPIVSHRLHVWKQVSEVLDEDGMSIGSNPFRLIFDRCAARSQLNPRAISTPPALSTAGENVRHFSPRSQRQRSFLVWSPPSGIDV